MERPASLRLLLSGLIDGALWVVPPGVIAKLALDPFERTGGTGGDGGNGLAVVIVLALVCVAAGLLWLGGTVGQLALLALARRTLGMWVVRVRFARADGAELSGWRAMGRGAAAALAPLLACAALAVGLKLESASAGALLGGLAGLWLLASYVAISRGRTLIDVLLGTVAVG